MLALAHYLSLKHFHSLTQKYDFQNNSVSDVFSIHAELLDKKCIRLLCSGFVTLHQKGNTAPGPPLALLGGENVSRLISNGAFICRWSVGAECFTNIRSAEGKLLQNI